MKKISSILESRCIRWLAIMTGLISMIAGFFLIVQPTFQTGSYNEHHYTEFYNSWVLFFVLAKSALYCLLIFLLIAFLTNLKRLCLYVFPLLMLITGWNMFVSSLPTKIVFEKSIQNQRILAYLDSANRTSIQFSGRKVLHDRVKDTTNGLHYQCLIAETWWFGNFWIEKRNRFSETETYNVHDQAIRKVDSNDSFFIQNCKSS